MNRISETLTDFGDINCSDCNVSYKFQAELYKVKLRAFVFIVSVGIYLYKVFVAFVLIPRFFVSESNFTYYI